MRILKWLLGLVVALAVLVFGGGLLISPDYAVSRSVLVQAPAERIFSHLDSANGWSRWGVWYRRDPQMRIETRGLAQGRGATWSWTSASQGNGKMTPTEVQPPRRVAYELRIEDFPPSQGELTVETEGGATRVTWRMQGRMEGTLGRWFGLFMDRLVGPDFEAGLANLKALAEKPA